MPAARGLVCVVSAGTSDAPVAAEAALTLRRLGAGGRAASNDVGVAGLHRLLGARDRARRGRLPVVVAGMEGALPSVVGGLIGVPLVAVPTSVGYGAAFGGLAALLAMLNSCAPGVDGREHRQRLRRGRLRRPGRPTRAARPGRGARAASAGSTRRPAPAATCCSARWSTPASTAEVVAADAVDAVAPERIAVRPSRSRAAAIAATQAVVEVADVASRTADLERRPGAHRRGRPARRRAVALRASACSRGWPRPRRRVHGIQPGRGALPRGGRARRDRRRRRACAPGCVALGLERLVVLAGRPRLRARSRAAHGRCACRRRRSSSCCAGIPGPRRPGGARAVHADRRRPAAALGRRLGRAAGRWPSIGSGSAPAAATCRRMPTSSGCWSASRWSTAARAARPGAGAGDQRRRPRPAALAGRPRRAARRRRVATPG